MLCIGSIGVLVNMCELTRPLTVRFSYQGITRLEHEEGLDGLEECIEPAQVKAIQITESACFITVVSKLGRFNVRLFSDNKTECKICSNIIHFTGVLIKTDPDN